jgi:hypothetical protein
VTVKELLTKLRLRISDMQKTKFSDYELFSALNDAMLMLWITLAENFSSIPRRKVKLTLVNGAASLPRNYYSLVWISPGAIVDGFSVKGEGGTAELEYNSCAPRLVTTEDIAYSDTDIAFLDDDPLVPIAPVLKAVSLDLVEIAAAITQGQTEAAAQIAKSTAARLSQKREYAAIPDTRPFP